jgi:hypothetical protein
MDNMHFWLYRWFLDPDFTLECSPGLLCWYDYDGSILPGVHCEKEDAFVARYYNYERN